MKHLLNIQIRNSHIGSPIPDPGDLSIFLTRGAMCSIKDYM